MRRDTKRELLGLWMFFGLGGWGACLAVCTAERLLAGREPPASATWVFAVFAAFAACFVVSYGVLLRHDFKRRWPDEH